jgi:hypothetical protein
MNYLVNLSTPQTPLHRVWNASVATRGPLCKYVKTLLYFTWVIANMLTWWCMLCSCCYHTREFVSGDHIFDSLWTSAMQPELRMWNILTNSKQSLNGFQGVIPRKFFDEKVRDEKFRIMKSCLLQVFHFKKHKNLAEVTYRWRLC